MTVDAEPLRRVWTIPNVISVLRLVVFLPFTVLALTRGEDWLALAALAGLGVTDWLDGFLARRLGQVSEFGKILDPIADRLSIVVVGIALTALGIVPWELIAIIFLVDLALVVVTLGWFRGAPGLEVSRVGKVRTAVVLVALPVLILGRATSLAWVDAVGLALLVIGTVGHVVAGLGYLAAMYRARPMADSVD